MPGKAPILPGKFCTIVCIMLACILIGKISVLDMFTFRPEHSPKLCSIFLSLSNSVANGFAKKAASSAYKEHLNLACFGRTGCSNPCYAAFSRILWTGSITIIKSNGDNGSPCLSPLACLIFWLGLPFISILEDDDPRIEDIQFCHFVLNLNAVRTSNRYCQPMESKAFEMSNLINRAGCFFLCKAWITLWT